MPRDGGLDVCFRYANTRIVKCLLVSARKHARQALGKCMHQIGIPKGHAEVQFMKLDNTREHRYTPLMQID
jgi:hypothetical protein